MTGPADLTVHATCVVIGEAGILIRGRSGAGKSTLGLRLIATAFGRDRFAALVADDRVALAARGGRLVARPVTPLAGWLEVRGSGIVRLAHEPACRVRLVVDLMDDPARLPDPDGLTAEILGVRLPRCVPPDRHAAESVVALRFRGTDDTIMTEV